ncbi:UDP-glucose/GDP-mannose dehydrogenase family protein [Niveibacterium sp. 24ML]|uniref:UDP-glucose dehydrogenase family protein n=1 Tax=Niveibacterium sp. 24ML TaxID=2985512 RepID=UPI0022720AB1|nr:UDP-glucose/GDP-mannose dehydrogenase family protein [Niveibacterium sp. 24ML]MCX9156660.1 UDP-glucose/GDP-mannose dehydrogenase family protein [Niveibacterium sp. 24ML]
MRITVIGSGYVGLVTAACLADVGNNVVCLDVDAAKIARLESGDVPIFEPGLDKILHRNKSAGRISYTTDAKYATEHGDVQFIAVGTPPDEDGSADLQYVLAAARTIATHMNGYKVVVDKSTVPVGTADKVNGAIAEVLAKRGATIDYAVVSNPEFLKEGAAIEDFTRPDRIVLGVESDRALAIMRAIYEPFQRNHDKLVVMDIRSAELTKYAANAMLATRISFMNELSRLAEALNADIELVRKGIGSDPRIGFGFLYAGCGYGGSCFPKDVKALISTAEKALGTRMRILSAVEDVNEEQKMLLVDKLTKEVGEDLSERRVAIWGLAFKPDTDDMREAPSRVIINALLARGAKITAYDPVAVHEAQRVLPETSALTFAADPYSAANDADALIVVTEWKEFRSLDISQLRDRMKGRLIIDGRNIFDPVVISALGFDYRGIGRKSE